ncbi:hypothetical protein V1264_015921 [Littorina saxatilis]|uniref:VWFA domain-containing protein n=2 Tax=Littorina saxatilis TaxID=31220 RepID=A0AAN9BN73_9CAEN
MTVNNGSQSGNYSKENATRDNFENEFILGNKRPRDILIIVDASASINEAGLKYIKGGLKQMVDLFCGGFGENTTNHRMAIAQFSSDAVGSYSFKAKQSKQDLYDAIDALYPMFAYTCTAEALTFARTVFDENNGGRFDSPSRSDTLLITDGQSNCDGNVTEAARQLQEVSTVWALGINVQDNPGAKAEIQSIVSRNDPYHIFSLGRFADFETMIENIKESRGTDGPCIEIEDEHSINQTSTTSFP